MEPWNGTGKHQLCCLACGHLFGKKCISKWLKEKKKCPKCNKPSRASEIRLLFVEKIAVVDTSNRDSLLQQLERERDLRKQAETQRMQLEMNMKLLQSELNLAKRRVQSSLPDRPNNSIAPSAPAPAPAPPPPLRHQLPHSASPSSSSAVEAVNLSEENSDQVFQVSLIQNGAEFCASPTPSSPISSTNSPSSPSLSEQGNQKTTATMPANESQETSRASTTRRLFQEDPLPSSDKRPESIAYRGKFSIVSKV